MDVSIVKSVTGGLFPDVQRCAFNKRVSWIINHSAQKSSGTLPVQRLSLHPLQH